MPGPGLSGRWSSGICLRIDEKVGIGVGAQRGAGMGTGDGLVHGIVHGLPLDRGRNGGDDTACVQQPRDGDGGGVGGDGVEGGEVALVELLLAGDLVELDHANREWVLVVSGRILEVSVIGAAVPANGYDAVCET